MAITLTETATIVAAPHNRTVSQTVTVDLHGDDVITWGFKFDPKTPGDHQLLVNSYPDGLGNWVFDLRRDPSVNYAVTVYVITDGQPSRKR
ncbi:hypothetical protein DB35_10775 [Streptomyces abyssalis]|uniref:Uncharacterized protein n=1 Tax=Streptomyces abyssalis TaxID=933944 RepID=A0A1E7JHP8_9ACTN|nr:hypothetical protein [Streptomyces abyssalis]OEU86014.1 hypothetical protein AN215_27125 [Streptomyces abyssalis]OEU92520.1 hypothetical protein DB35_10775 [Streptomyces abyssalis]